MSMFDGFAGIIILYFAWLGFRNGLVKETFRIVGLVLAGFLSFQYANNLGNLIQPLIELQEAYYPYIAFAFLFIAIITAVQVAIFFLDTLIQLLLLSIPNRLFGALFGVIKSSLLISLVLIFLSGFGFPGNNVKQQSFLYKPLLKVAPASYDIVARVLPGVKPYRESVEKYLSVPVIPFLED